jgi:hypothetical protein
MLKRLIFWDAGSIHFRSSKDEQEIKDQLVLSANEVDAHID